MANPSRPMYFPPAPFERSEVLRCTRLVETSYHMYSQRKTQGEPKPDAFNWQPSENGDHDSSV
jgi:hypothetical protein